MATKIVTKNSSTAGAAPTATDLVQGELAVNVADKRLYTEDNAGAIVELGTNPSSLTVSGNIDVDGTTNLDVVDIDGAVDMASTLTVTGEITANGGIALGDGDVATFGAGDDLQIYHDGSNSHIKDTATGNLNISGNDIQILNAASNEAMAYFAQDGSVTLYHNGSEKLATTSTGIDITGNMIADGVGIGTDSLFFTASGRGSLSLNGSASSILAFGKNGSSENYMLADSGGFTIANTSATLPTKFFNNGSDRMTIDSSGNVGIGTSPSTKLHVQDSAGSPQIRIDNQGTASGIASLLFRSGGAGNPSSIIQSGGTSSGNQGIVFKHGDFGAEAERMRIDASGNLLVGKSSTAFGTVGIRLEGPNGKIEATRNNNVVMDLNRLSGDGTIANFSKDGTTVGSIGTLVSSLTIGSGDTGLLLQPAYDRILPFNVSTNAGRDNAIDLGASDVRFKDLYLSGKAQADSLQFAQNSSATGATEAVYRPTTGAIAFKSNSAERMRIDSSGNLLVGKTSTGDSIVGIELQPSGALVSCRNSSIAALFNRLSSNGEVVRFNRQGVDVGSIDVTTTATSYTTSSDQRLKENIADADDAGSKIDAIQVRKYDWKADGSHQDYGMIAQELLEVAPEAVSQGETEEEMMGVDYSKLVPMLLKEIQSLRNRVAQLETGE